jgi:hypothetical protein
MNELAKRPDRPISEEQQRTYAGMYLLKKMDLTPADGGVPMPVLLPSELAPLEDVLSDLAVAGHIEINRRKERYELTRKGLAYLGELIDEAEALIREFDDWELEDVIAELRARNLDVFRARFLWGWYTGELDDLVLFQQRRGVVPVEPFWAFYLTGDDFFNELAKDTEAAPN